VKAEVQRLQNLSLRMLSLWGVALLVFTIPLKQVIAVSGSGTLAKLVGFTVFPVALVTLWRERTLRPWSEVHLMAGAYALWAALSYFWSLDPAASLRSLASLAQLLAMFLLIWEFARTRRDIRLLLGSLVAACYVIASATIFRYLTTHGLKRYAFAQGIQPNSVAFVLGLAIPAAWYLGVTSRSPRARALWCSYVVPALVASLLTGSRGGLFTTAIALMILPWTVVRWSAEMKLAVGVGAVACCLVIGALWSSKPVARLLTTAQEIQQGDYDNRRQLWEAALAAFAARPVGGIGIGASREWIRQQTGREDGAHNTYLSVSAELGAVGLCIFGLLLLSVGRMVAVSRGTDRKLGLVLLITLMVGLTPRHWELEKTTWLVLALIVAHSGALPAPERSSGAGESAGSEIGRRLGVTEVKV
jgi:O-antigen ligase